jgi:hypothetical protein
MSKNVKKGNKAIRKTSDKQYKNDATQKLENKNTALTNKQLVIAKQQGLAFSDKKNSIEIKIGDASITLSSPSNTPKGCFCDLCVDIKDKHICLCNSCDRHKQIVSYNIEVEYDCYNACGLLPKHLVMSKNKPESTQSIRSKKTVVPYKANYDKRPPSEMQRKFKGSGAVAWTWYETNNPDKTLEMMERKLSENGRCEQFLPVWKNNNGR